jgi:solute carrier family 25 (mitochondrial iron transporter), member 28/37
MSDTTRTLNETEEESETATATTIDEDWEEWDGTTPFWTHCVAGSIAGVVEHGAIYPLDTVRTHIQVCAACLNNHNHRGVGATTSLQVKDGGSTTSGTTFLRSAATTLQQQPHHHQPHQTPRLPLGTWQTIRYLMNESAGGGAAAAATLGPAGIITPPVESPPRLNWTGFTRLFRGIQTIVVGCIPAHALYFSSYEMVKLAFADSQTHHMGAAASSLAGAVATTAHDIIMTPLDTLKQRMQIGHYDNLSHAVKNVYRNEGIAALFRSFPVTLATNMPYGMIMVSTNEACKTALSSGDLNNGDRLAKWKVVLLSSSTGGFVAAALTTPLDRIKTYLQTQTLAPVQCVKPDICPKKKKVLMMMMQQQQQQLQQPHLNWYQAATRIYTHEGPRGFVRGLTPRVLSHTPAVAISWTTYETAKQYLYHGVHQ